MLYLIPIPPALFLPPDNPARIGAGAGYIIGVILVAVVALVLFTVTKIRNWLRRR